MELLDYYDTPGVRMTCHSVKIRNHGVVHRHDIGAVVQHFLDGNLVNRNDILIPVPQHTGRAEYTYDIAEALSYETEAFVADIVRCVPHKESYVLKKEGKAVEVDYYLTDAVPAGNIFLIDNVISSGQTILDIQRILQRKVCPLVYAVDYTRFSALDRMAEIIPDNLRLHRLSSGSVCIE